MLQNMVSKFIIFAIHLVPLITAQMMKVYSLSGSQADYFKMTRHPGKTEVQDLSLCMRWYPVQMPKVSLGNMIILASVMEGGENGIKDEYFTLYHGTKEAETDNYGRELGSYLMATGGCRLLLDVT